MSIFYLEEIKKDLLSNLAYEKAPIKQLELLNIFFEQVIESKDINILEVFLTEFNSKYTNCLLNLIVIGLDPGYVEPIINSTKNILGKSNSITRSKKLTREFERIYKEIQTVKTSLNGEIISQDPELISFPVRIQHINKKENYGHIETFSIKIHKDFSLNEDKFLIVPSSDKLETRFAEQIKIAWDIAINYLKIYYKNPNTYHEVVLIFSHKFANIAGYSLGFAITLGFIQELFKFYNTSLTLTLNGNVTFTGGFNSDQTIKSIGEEIMSQKIETVFFSPFNYFAIPDADLIPAKNRLNELLIKSPKKKLKIISIQDFDDFINHRQIIKIDKAKLADRSKKYLRKNYLAIALFALLFLVVGFYFSYSIDNNPSEFRIVGKTVNVTNKHGKILWSIMVGDDEKYRTLYSDYFQRIYDVDNDGINEVIIAHESLENKDMENHGRIACYDSDKKLMWKYKFRDTVFTNNESYSDEYRSKLIEIVTINDKNILVAMSRHNFFPSAIYRIDASSGKRLKGTVWSQGHFNSAQIDDFDKDGKNEIFAGGINNGLESAFALIIDLDTLEVQTPSIDKYLFNDIDIGSFKKFYLFSRTDVCKFYKNRFNGTDVVHYYEDTKTFQIGVDEKYPGKLIGPQYVISSKFDSAWIQIGDDLQFIRDSLVIKGLINGSLTNDPQYSIELLDGIKEWNGKNFGKFRSNN